MPAERRPSSDLSPLRQSSASQRPSQRLAQRPAAAHAAVPQAVPAKPAIPRTSPAKPASTVSKPPSGGGAKIGGALLMILTTLVMACLAGVYLLTGVDIFGVFTASSAAPTPVVVEVTVPVPLPVLVEVTVPVTVEVTAEPPGVVEATALVETPMAPPVETQVVEPSPISPPSSTWWWKVFFTNPATINDPNNLSGSVEEQLINYIKGAKKSIHIASFEFNLTPVAKALIAARKRGVEVRWITDDEHGLGADWEEDRGQFAMLQKAKIKVIDDQRTALMHNKFWIFDGELVWTGSTNVTQNDMFRNNNNVIVFESPEAAAIYERQFQEMWNGQFGPDSPSEIVQQAVKIENTPIQFLFSPEDNVIGNQLIPLVQKARRSIYFMAFSYTHDGLTQAMLERAGAGVKVQGIFETRGSETEYSALPPMFCAKLPVRQDGNPGTFHHKVIVIDRKIVITGSLNFSANADDSNSENTIVIANSEIARLYIEEFQRRWAEAKEPDAADMNCP